MKVTNHDLHLMLTEIKGDVKNLVEKTDNSIQWQKDHEDKDEKRFSGLNKYAASVAIVAGVAGAGASWIWSKITGA